MIRLAWTAAVVTLLGGCATSHAMQQRLDDGSCPVRYTALTSTGQPDGRAPSVLMWSGPTEARDVDKNDAWCRTVEPAVLRAPSGPGLEGANVVDSVAIITWNINVGGATS